MSNFHTIDGKEYLPAIAAGKHFGYSKDYLLLLIKNGKIEGRKIGNKWYVDVSSAELFFVQAEKERKEKRRQMSIDRKLELRTHDISKDNTYKQTAILETVVIVLIGLSIGATGYLGVSSENMSSVSEAKSSFFENTAVALYRVLSHDEKPISARMSAQSIRAEDTATYTPETNASAGTDATSLVVAPVEQFSQNSVDTVRDSFSDEVEITPDPLDGDTGLVVPKFKDTTGEAYRFLMVPVHTDEKL